MFVNKAFASQTLTDSGTVYLNPGVNLEDNFKGTVLFTVKGTKATGTFGASAQLQGSNSSDFSTGVINLGSPVNMSDATNAAVPLSGTDLYYAYYRVVVTGSQTQSTAVIGTVTIKGGK
jgi:hypothetical protein